MCAPNAVTHTRPHERLLSLEGWKRLVTGAVDYRKLFRGILRSGKTEPSSLARDVAAALSRHKLPVEAILASGDATAIAAEAEMKAAGFKGSIGGVRTVETDSHTFARPGDHVRLKDATLAAIESIEARAAPR